MEKLYQVWYQTQDLRASQIVQARDDRDAIGKLDSQYQSSKPTKGRLKLVPLAVQCRSDDPPLVFRITSRTRTY